MLSRLGKLLLSALLLAESVRAGHRSFEPKLSLDRGLSRALESNVTTNTRRWVRTTGGSWPDKTIPFCFENDEARQRLLDPIRIGFKKWHTAGLPNTFKMIEVLGDCVDDPDTLLVSYDFRLETTPGKPSDGTRPRMTLTDRDDVALMDVYANVAHEIGHAWGLEHEAQNPWFWKEGEGIRGARGGSIFGKDTWKCENLADYQSTLEDIQRKIDHVTNTVGGGEAAFGHHREQICKSKEIASWYGFSATQWLPLLDHLDKFHPGTQLSRDKDIDWRSIMMYPSTQGGRIEGGTQLKVMLKPDGTDILINQVPTARDVRGLLNLYGHDEYEELLLNDLSGGSLGIKFEEVRGEDVGGCDS